MILIGVVAVVIGVSMGFFWLSNRSSEMAIKPTPTPTAVTESRNFPIRLNPQGDLGRPGTLVLTEENGRAKILIGLGGGASSVAQPAHIHTGTCAEMGEVKYSLSNVVAGASQTVLDVGMDYLLNQRPLSVNVHKSAAELNISVSCGDL